MKRVKEFKKMFEVEGALKLKQLKKQYRTLVKEWHPDKFPEGGEKALEAEAKSRKIIEGYHFLVSMAPETKEAQKEEYTALTTNSGIQETSHKGLLLEITFLNGDTYEYFGVNGQLYNKFLNADNQYRFAKRKVFNAFTYRKAKSGSTDEGQPAAEEG
jgi:curved DNA-binding protein CbpA